MSVDEFKDKARAELRQLVQPTAEPQLTDEELEQLLNASQRATIWTASTVYKFGDVAQPTKRNGHRYVCTLEGTSATVEPTWSTRDNAVISDGSVFWREAGPDYANIFDIREAAHRAWQMKAAKASELYDRSGQAYSQIVEHCLQMAQRLAPIALA